MPQLPEMITWLAVLPEGVTARSIKFIRGKYNTTHCVVIEQSGNNFWTGEGQGPKPKEAFLLAWQEMQRSEALERE